MPTPPILCRICGERLKKKNHWMNINLHQDCLEEAVIEAAKKHQPPAESEDEQQSSPS